MRQRLKLPSKAQCLFVPARHHVLHGGRASAKSRSIATRLLLKSRSSKRLIFCGREIQNSIADSSFATIQTVIRQYSWESEFSEVNNEIVHKGTGSRFFFRGLWRNVDSVKSTEGITDAWIEEAQSVSKDSIDVLIPTIREEGSELFWSYNPRFETDAVDVLFRRNEPPPKSIVQEMNWTDNPFLPDVIRETISYDYQSDPIKAAHVWGGGYKTNTDGALWTDDIIRRAVPPGPLDRVIVAVDPAVTATKHSDETGIVVVGLFEGVAYVLSDLSGRYTPAQWGRVACDALERYDADRIVAEKNQGGDMVRHTIKTVNGNAPVTLVHASRGKVARAEPVAALYEDGKVFHATALPKLEAQLRTWKHGEPSPDRLDALVWGVSHLMLRAAAASPAIRTL